MSLAAQDAGAGSGKRASATEQGQASVELALLLPLLMLMALFLAQLALTARDQIMVSHSAREAARTVAVSNEPSLARSAVLAASRLDPQRLVVRVEDLAGSDNVSVRLDYRSAVRFAPLALFVDHLKLSAEVVMRRER